jgi:hypothetical protein
MKTSESILEVFEQNARWWQKAADHCESLGTQLPDPNKKEEFMFMSAVYQERADLHAHLVEQLRGGEDIEPVIPRERGILVENGPTITVVG